MCDRGEDPPFPRYLTDTHLPDPTGYSVHSDGPDQPAFGPVPDFDGTVFRARHELKGIRRRQ